MCDTRQSLSFNSSAASSQVDCYDNMELTKIKNYVKDLLKARLFLGRYMERRLVNLTVGYRDVVLISPAETDLKRDLMEALYKLRSVCSNHWIGITDTEILGYHSAGVCLWTEIENQPFGPFWFQIKAIKFRDQEIIVNLKCIRHISETFLELEPILTGSGAVTKKIKDVPEVKLDNTVSLNETYTEIIGNLRAALSISNVKEFITFLFAFIIAIFTGSTAFINFLGNFVLALIREMAILIKNSTPMFLGVLDCFSKIVGGFYILLAMVFKQSAPPPLHKRYERQPLTYDQRKMHSSNYDSHYDDRNFD